MTDPASLEVTIVDGYVDEPAHFGVPPFVSTYPRYVAGALVDAGVPPVQITYHTIDSLRDDRSNWNDVADATVTIYVGGMTVPGKYVGGTPAEPDEVRRIAWVAEGTTLLGGPVRFGVADANEGASETQRRDLDFDYVARGDVEAATYDLITSGVTGFDNRLRTNEEVNRWARLGAFIVEQHPNHPGYLICELETSRGCAYRCSFCTEPLYGNPTFRTATSIIDEAAALASHGIAHFRLGRQADILAFGGDGEAPNPDAFRRLYRGIREAVPDLRTLHMDNMNPLTIIEYPEAARECIEVIAKYNTPGDTAAFGLESADPLVQEQNDLLVSAEECLEAVKIVNEVAGWRPGDRSVPHPLPLGERSDLPKLLPGINLVHGLKGERRETFEHNFRFLSALLEQGLLVRRINVRQVMAFPGTEMSDAGAAIAHDHKALFKQYKRRIREEIDRPMLERVAPPGTRLRNVHLEYHQDGMTFGRELGTYALLVGVPGQRPLDAIIDVVVTDHGYRSVTGVPYPLDINSATMDELEELPGVGRNRAGSIVVDRPYSSLSEVPIDVDLRPYATVGDGSSPPDTRSVSDITR